MSGTARRLLYYSDEPGWKLLAMTAGCGAFALYLLARIVDAPSSVHREHLVGLVIVLVFAWRSQALFFRFRPIAVSDEGIEALIGDRVWRRIAWHDMDRIEKRFVAEKDDSEGGVIPSYDTIQFRSGGHTILVRSTILGFDALRRRANDEAKRRGIRMVAVEPRLLWHAPIITPLDEL